MVVATGIITEQDLVTGAQAAYQDPRFRPDLRCFHDFSGATNWRVSTDLMMALAAKRQLSDKSRTAILVTGPLGFGLSRVFQTWVDLGQVKITYDRAEAVAWLNEGVPQEKHIT